MEVYSVIGVMSGTSLDGLDLVYCSIKAGVSFSFEIHTALTYEYTNEWKHQLANAHTLPLERIKAIDVNYTQILSEFINRFIDEHQITNLDFIASHGHTVLHQPEKKLTYQIGNLPELAKLTGCNVICDFRVQDVELGGQGAPLVPIGDRLLFSEYDACVNLGGFANISYESNGKRLAFDICPVNKVLNRYAELLGQDYDEGGRIAKASVVNSKLLSELNTLQYYSSPGPKSLGIEWLEAEFLPLLDQSGLKSEEIMATCTQHFAHQIAIALQGKKKVLFTGGGSFNSYLMQLITEQSSTELIIPNPEVVNYKEALIFALLGVLRERNEINVLASVTGASHDHSSGEVFLP
ncbi:anhydro-N-acetylmuramic acid kinase [Psychroflexus tropicus]|uniref:anhydro-N-acetylmuramic acid kinase n=1 Tax=Psychroflexus tropicus TaxID=197345 RepID=UPI000360E2DF|nr:anhydro-N-acetylmuramic acid kinase [Psychroflexus tropicus]